MYLCSIRLTLITNCLVDNKDTVTLVHCPTKIRKSFLALCLANVRKDANRHVWMVFIHHHLWVDPSLAGHRTIGLITGQPPERFIASAVQKVQVCGTGVLKRGYLSPTQRRIITFYCDLWRLGSPAGSIHSVLTNNSPTQTSSLGLIIAGSGKNCWTSVISGDLQS